MRSKARAIWVTSSLLALSAEAHAQRGPNKLANWLVGPVIGIRLGGPDGERGIFGMEGGIGWGPERLNIGVSRRLGAGFAYVELDPWYILGASLGVGIDTNLDISPVVGLWEGVPLMYPGCSNHVNDAVTLAAGYRWTGVHELYLTFKIGQGEVEGHLCD